ncbi:glycosyltransferase family 2 protein [Actinospongicola halichondriae]|uniref:glycosyltransferase family 2 protein n=1 Tax=Actinospongicola halichondriae TaxID=3236844 RepID=UPI003D417677
MTLHEIASHRPKTASSLHAVGAGSVLSSDARHDRFAIHVDDEPRWVLRGDADLHVEVTVSVVIPAMNEALNLPYLLPQLPPGVAEVILVDGRSTDDTVAVATAIRPDIKVVHQTGKGKGDALRAGFDAATGDIIVMIDADGSMSPREIPRYIEALANGADVVTGSRQMEGGGSADITPLRKWGNDGLNMVFAALYGVRHTDLCYGYMAFWSHALEKLDLDCDGFEIETLVNVRAAKADLSVVEVPSHEARRLHGESNLRTFRDGFRVLRTLLTERRNARV